MIYLIVTFYISLHLDVVKTDENVEPIQNWCPHVAIFDAHNFKLYYMECKDGENGLPTNQPKNISVTRTHSTFWIDENGKMFGSSSIAKGPVENGLIRHNICKVLKEWFHADDYNYTTKLEFDPSIRLIELMDNKICSYGDKTNVFDFINAEDPLNSCSYKFRIKGAEMTMGKR